MIYWPALASWIDGPGALNEGEPFIILQNCICGNALTAALRVTDGASVFRCYLGVIDKIPPLSTPAVSKYH
jgi:hypothetical protein